MFVVVYFSISRAHELPLQPIFDPKQTRAVTDLWSVATVVLFSTLPVREGERGSEVVPQGGWNI